MPTYDYVCTSCGFEFELMQRITDPPKQRCPKCRKKLQRKIGAGAGLLFKGSGFYITDYRSSEYKEKAKVDTGAATSGAGKDTGKEGVKETKKEGKKTGTAGESAPAKPEAGGGRPSEGAKGRKGGTESASHSKPAAE